MAERAASATWRGSLTGGGGTVSALSSGVFSDLEVTWASRTETPGGKTSPEELIAAAHAACFCMALSNELSQRGHEPARLQIGATCSFEGGRISRVVLDVEAEVPGADDGAFREALDAAEKGCPVSNAVRGNVDIRVEARLA